VSATLRLSLLPGGIALGLYAEWAALRRGPLEEATSTSEIRLAVADLVVGLVLLGCGLVAWTRRPESRTGALLAAAGLAWFLGTFAASGASGYSDFGTVFVTLHRGPLAQALLSYPTGRFERTTDRIAVAFAYAVSAIADLGESSAAMAALAAVLLVVGIRRYLDASGPGRRARAVATTATAAFAVVLFVSGISRLVGSSPSMDRAVLWAYMIIVAAIASGLTLDLVLGRWVPATVTGLVVDLGEQGQGMTLRERLANALGDRSLVLGYRLADREVYVDERGRELELPEGNHDRRVTIVREGAEPVAALVHDAHVDADPELVQSVAAAARMALANVRLQAAIRRQVGELEASRRRMVEAGDAERRRLEQELREGAERRLADVGELLGEARRRATEGSAVRLADAQTKLERTRSELRELALGIHPRALADGGLAKALGELAHRSAVSVELTAPDLRFDPAVEAAVYFVCSEALTNTSKHAGASHAAITVTQRDRALVVSIRDDGRGGATLAAGSGLRGLADRLETLGGQLTVLSPTGDGTLVVAELPLS
jgi:signal transduction histidine kinase